MNNTDQQKQVSSSKDVKETQNKEAILKKTSTKGSLAGAKLWEKN